MILLYHRFFLFNRFVHYVLSYAFYRARSPEARSKRTIIEEGSSVSQTLVHRTPHVHLLQAYLWFRLDGLRASFKRRTGDGLDIGKRTEEHENNVALLMERTGFPLRPSVSSPLKASKRVVARVLILTSQFPSSSWETGWIRKAFDGRSLRKCLCSKMWIKNPPCLVA